MCQVFKPAKIFLRKIYAGKPISISLSPNTEKDDIRLALRLLFRPWCWKRFRVVPRSFPRGSAFNAEETLNYTQNYAEKLENEFKKYFGVKYAFAFNSGRSAFMAILNSLLQENSSSVAPSGSEERRRVGGDSASAKASADKGVLLQAFTCNAAVNPIIWSNLKLIFVDCNEDDFNIDIEDLKRKISTRPAAGGAGGPEVLVVQHTFGLPANMDEIVKICEQNNLILIEDCAHSLGATYNGKRVGTFGKAAFFSFSRDKVISSVYGGMVITNDDQMAEKIKKFQQESGYPSYCWIFQQLLHPVLLNYIILPIYNFIDLGKIFLIFSQWLHILSKAVHWKEKRGKKPVYFPKRMPNALAILALHQFQKLEKFNEHRKKIAEFYYQELKSTAFELPKKFPRRENIFLRFTIKHPKAHEILWQAWKKQNILIGDWYTSPIAPDDTQLDKVGYKLGSCPKAEKLAKITLNLPTHINISKENAQKIVNFLKNFSTKT